MFQAKATRKSFGQVTGDSEINFSSTNQLLQTVNDVESLLALHSIFIEEDDSDIESMFNYYNGSEEVVHHISSLKSEGNLLFKSLNFKSALLIYQKAVKYICVTVPMVCDQSKIFESFPNYQELVISPHLNIAACELKLLNFGNVVHCCSLILRIDDTNVKARFRRGSAFLKLGLVDKAIVNLEKSLSIDSFNKEIQLELSKIEKPQSNVSEVSTPSKLGSKRQKVDVEPKGLGTGLRCLRSEEGVGVDLLEKHIVEGVSFDLLGGHATGDLQCASPFTKNISLKGEEGNGGVKSSQVNEQDKGERLCVTQIVDGISPVEERLSQENVANGSTISTKACAAKMERPTKMEVDLKEQSTDGSNPNQSSHLRRKVTYRNKKNPTSFLKLSIEDVKQLRNGKALQFYISHSLSFLKVHTFTSKNQIQIEAPHTTTLREAAVYECKVVSKDCHSIADSDDYITFSEKSIMSNGPRVGTEETQHMSRVDKVCKIEPMIGDKEGSKAIRCNTISSVLENKDDEFEGSCGRLCWQRDHVTVQDFTLHENSFHHGTSFEKVGNSLFGNFNHLSSFKMKNDRVIQLSEHRTKVKSNQSSKSKAAAKVRKKALKSLRNKGMRQQTQSYIHHSKSGKLLSLGVKRKFESKQDADNPPQKKQFISSGRSLFCSTAEGESPSSTPCSSLCSSLNVVGLLAHDVIGRA